MALAGDMLALAVDMALAGDMLALAVDMALAGDMLALAVDMALAGDMLALAVDMALAGDMFALAVDMALAGDMLALAVDMALAGDVLALAVNMALAGDMFTCVGCGSGEIRLESGAGRNGASALPSGGRVGEREKSVHIDQLVLGFLFEMFPQEQQLDPAGSVCSQTGVAFVYRNKRNVN
eukprot:gene31943-8940_t